MSVSFLNEPTSPASTTISTIYGPTTINMMSYEEYAQRWAEIIKFYNDYWNPKPLKSTRRVQRIKRRKINGKRSCTCPMYKRGRPTFKLVRSQLHR